MRALTQKGDWEGQCNQAERKGAVRAEKLGCKGKRIDLHERKGDLQGGKNVPTGMQKSEVRGGKRPVGGKGDLAIRAGQLLWPGLFRQGMRGELEKTAT